MSQPYEEILSGRKFTRPAPVERHELICSRLHALIKASTANLASARLLEPRSRVQISHDNFFCPDLAIVTAATGKLWLAAEVIGREDHRVDTVTKKELYEHAKLPRLWMVDPRYDNVEIYHATQHGLVLQGILAGHEALTEKLLPEFTLTIAALFAEQSPTTP
jgi:Uma2 family endonuclease